MSDKNFERLDFAARAGWLYYVAGFKQDEIAAELKISRQSAQRLVSLAVEEKLVKFKIDHPIASCMEYSNALSDKFGLTFCEVTPTDPKAPDSLNGIAVAGSNLIESYLGHESEEIIALGTGRSLKACIEQVTKMSCPHHRLVSMAGNLKSDGSATSFSTTVSLADRVGAQHNPYPVPVFATTAEEKNIWQKLGPNQKTLELSQFATVTLVGIGPLTDHCPIIVDGMLAPEDVSELIDAGGIGEIIGWAFTAEGKIIQGLSNDRNTSAALVQGTSKPVIAIAQGEPKAEAILAALKGQLINGVVTNELTAKTILSLA